MSIGGRLLNLVKANLNALLDSVRKEDATLGELTDEELEAELVRRRDRKRREEEMRAAREAAERAARERGAERQRAPTGGGARTKPSSAPRAGARPGAPRGGDRPPPRPAPVETPQARLARLYRTLETPVGSDLEKVKSNFRRLMRKHHPDLNSSTPETQRQATERSKIITQAYAELEKHLTSRPRR